MAKLNPKVAQIAQLRKLMGMADMIQQGKASGAMPKMTPGPSVSDTTPVKNNLARALRQKSFKRTPSRRMVKGSMT